MRKGSKEAKEWGAKMQRLRKRAERERNDKNSSRKGSSTNKGSGKKVSKKRRDKSPIIDVVPDAIAIGGVTYGVVQALNGEYGTGIMIAVAGLLGREVLEEVGKKVFKRFRKSHKFLGIRFRGL